MKKELNVTAWLITFEETTRYNRLLPYTDSLFVDLRSFNSIFLSRVPCIEHKSNRVRLVSYYVSNVFLTRYELPLMFNTGKNHCNNEKVSNVK